MTSAGDAVTTAGGAMTAGGDAVTAAGGAMAAGGGPVTAAEGPLTAAEGPLTTAGGAVAVGEGLVPVAEGPVAGREGRAYGGGGRYDPESTLRLRVLPARGRPEPAPGYTFDEITRADWALGPVPDTGWSAAPSPRRTWVGRALLACLLLVQAILSLRLHNTAFEDEALYVYAGHAMIDHLFHGTPDYGGFGTYFSGSPVLYPVLAAWVDSVGGLTAVRLMSLAFMLAATGLLYSFTRMLFNERTALCAAGIFAVSQSTLFLGNFATYDALAILLLALSAWILVRVVQVVRVVRVAHDARLTRLARGHWALPLAAAPVAALAVGVKYASALYLPTVTVLLVLAAHRRLGGRQALRLGAVFTGGVTVLLGIGLATTDYLQAIRSTTTDRAHGSTSVPTMAWDCFRWGGLLFALACLGTVLYARRERLGEVPGRRVPAGPGTRWRLALGAVLTGTALLAPAYQIHLQTSVSLHKHIGYGLLFAAPMAGVGITRLMGAHFRFPQAALAVGVLALTLGMSQSAQNYGVWPSTTYLMPELAKNVRPGQKWLGQPHEAPVYYLSREGLTDYTLWTSIYYIDYTGRQGRHLMGAEGYRAAIDDGWFDGVVLDWSDQPGDVQALIRGEMRTSGRYRLAGALSYRTSVGTGHFEIWLRVPAAHGR